MSGGPVSRNHDSQWLQIYGITWEHWNVIFFLVVVPLRIIDQKIYLPKKKEKIHSNKMSPFQK